MVCWLSFFGRILFGPYYESIHVETGPAVRQEDKRFGGENKTSRNKPRGAKKVFLCSWSFLLSGFWLQGGATEIDVVQFTHNNNGTGSKYHGSHHCFVPRAVSAEKTVSGPDITYATAKVGEFVTYGLEYLGQNLTFFRNGVATGAASASCLASSTMHVVFTHDMMPALGGYNDRKTWDVAPYNKSASPAVMVIEYFKFWETSFAKGECAYSGNFSNFRQSCSGTTVKSSVNKGRYKRRNPAGTVRLSRHGRSQELIISPPPLADGKASLDPLRSVQFNSAAQQKSGTGESKASPSPDDQRGEVERSGITAAAVSAALLVFVLAGVVINSQRQSLDTSPAVHAARFDPERDSALSSSAAQAHLHPNTPSHDHKCQF